MQLKPGGLTIFNESVNGVPNSQNCIGCAESDQARSNIYCKLVRRIVQHSLDLDMREHPVERAILAAPGGLGRLDEIMIPLAAAETQNTTPINQTCQIFEQPAN